MDDIYTIDTSAFPSTTRIVSFRGVESLSRPYRFEIFVQMPADDAKSIDLADVVGAKATLAMHADRKEGLTFRGILSTVDMLHAHASFALFRAVLEPRFVRLKHSIHSRIFTAKSFPDILKAVIEENGLTSSDYSVQLTGSYPVEEHVCQYQESDFDFLSRWMEHLGFYYFFEHDDTDKLVITDDKSSHTDLPSDPVRYFPVMAGDWSAGPAIESFRCRASALPASVKLKDYDYTKPTLDVSGTAPVASNGVGEVSVYGARLFTPSDASAFAKLRAAELLTRQLEHTGSSTVLLRAGFQFTLEDHPIDAFNIKYLATEVEHFGSLMGVSPDLAQRIDIPYSDVYRCNFTSIPDKVQFRPVRVTAWPRIFGFEHGVIDGAADTQYAQIDDHGRYNVKFTFDESDLKDGKASTWVRMMQPHGGGVEGFHFPLRKGTEIVFCFMGGDPDRPVIAGVVNNATTPSPITSSNNTRNVLQTGGKNRLEIEDQDGIQKISLSTPTANTFLKMGATDGGHELTLHTDANSLIDTIGNHDRKTVGDMTETVTGTMTEEVTGAVKETYSATQTVKVTGAVAETYSATQKTDISGNQTKTAGTRDLTVKGAHNETSNGAYTAIRNAGEKHLVTGGLIEIINPGITRLVGAAVNEVIGASVNQVIGGSVNQVVAGTVVQTIGGTFTQNVGGASNWNWHASKASFSFGATSDTFVGIKNSNSAAVSIDTYYGNKLSACLSGDLTLAAGAKVTIGEATELRKAPNVTVKADATYAVSSPAIGFMTNLLTANADLVKWG